MKCAVGASWSVDTFYLLMDLLCLSLWDLMLFNRHNESTPVAIFLLLALVAQEHQKEIEQIKQEEVQQVLSHCDD